MRQNGATLRLVAGDIDHSFGVDAVVRAADRATSTNVEDTEETIVGQLACCPMLISLSFEPVQIAGRSKVGLNGLSRPINSPALIAL